MAALRDVVRDYQEELRGGIAWVVFWREGTSWDGQSVYLDDDGLLTKDDRVALTEILQKDAHAVALNSYYKTEFLTTFCEKVMEGDGLDAQTKSLIDRAVRQVYKDFLRSKGTGRVPLLGDFKAALEGMKHDRAKELSLALERFVEGALDNFSMPTNINTKNSLICYSLAGLRDQMKPLGTLITLDQLLSRVMRNYKQGKITFVYADEFALLFQDEDTGTFFSNLWRRIRKYNGYCTGATQNVEEVLASETGRAMLSNTDFVVMLNQSPTNAAQLAELYKISPNQEVYFRNVAPGHGLIKVGGALVPFVSSMPTDTKLYSLLSTNPREVRWD